MIDPPEALKKRGLLKVTDNRSPGQAVVLPPKLIVTLFGEELLRQLSAARKEHGNAD